MTEKGAAVIVISQDLEEIFQIADRVAVLHRGELSETFHIDTLTPEKIGLLMSGSDITELDAPEASQEPRPQPTLVASNAAKPEKAVVTPEVPQKPVAAMAGVVVQEPIASPPAPPTPPKTPERLSTSGTTSVQWTPPEAFHPVGRVQ